MKTSPAWAPHDLTGKIFGRWKVLCLATPRWSKSKPVRLWKCECTCGTVRDVLQWTILSGQSESCGCYARSLKPNLKHGKSGTATYTIWVGMKSRCRNPKAGEYKNYGGRGITVCPRWIDSFANFLADMGERPEGKSIERKDTNGNYEPDNCKWATAEEQCNNKRTCRYVLNGETLAQCARRIGVHYGTLRKHYIIFGKPINEAMEHAKDVYEQKRRSYPH